MGISLGFNLGPVRFSTSIRGPRGGGGGGGGGGDGFVWGLVLWVVAFPTIIASLSDDFWNFIYVWIVGATLAPLVAWSLSTHLVRLIATDRTKSSERVLLGLVGIVHYFAIFFWVRAQPWGFDSWTPFWMCVLGFCTSPLGSVLVAMRWRFTRTTFADRIFMQKHAKLMAEHGLTSADEIRGQLVRIEIENRKAKWLAESRRREQLEIERSLEEARLAREQEIASLSKRAIQPILDSLHSAVTRKLNPSPGDSITQVELVEAFRSAQSRLEELPDFAREHRLRAQELIGKLAFAVHEETGWKVLKSSPNA